ncbi:MAG TPA: hypothetical protein VIZ30_08395, partial [Pseudomonadales bacterium]
MTIVASAPGKLVVSGEYAVLVGAPALVLAVDRRVTSRLHDTSSGEWRFTSNGYAPDARHPLATLLGAKPLPRTDPAYLCQHVLRRLLTTGIALDTLPTALTIDIDSRAGFDAGHKLGLGTSAAVCATLSGALLARCGSTRDVFPIALDAHRAAQGGRGSGVDVAAACHGGLIRYEATMPDPRVTRVPFPAG